MEPATGENLLIFGSCVRGESLHFWSLHQGIISSFVEPAPGENVLFNFFGKFKMKKNYEKNNYCFDKVKNNCCESEVKFGDFSNQTYTSIPQWQQCAHFENHKSVILYSKVSLHPTKQSDLE